MNIIIQNIYSDLLELSDIALQKKLWLNQNNNTGLLSSYSELMCRLFDENDIESFIDNPELNKSLSSKAILELDLLRKLLNEYSEKNNDEEIINDIKWREIVQQGKNVIKEWNIPSGAGHLNQSLE